jgi:tRNA 2-thiouridine synthesizing protein E
MAYVKETAEMQTPNATVPPLQHANPPSGFPHAPADWSPAEAERLAAGEDVALTPEHWETLRSLQAYFANMEEPKVRELLDALDERFHARGGLKLLHKLFPNGPVAQGCRLAGLAVPPGAVDKSFGSAQ